MCEPSRKTICTFIIINIISLLLKRFIDITLFDIYENARIAEYIWITFEATFKYKGSMS